MRHLIFDFDGTIADTMDEVVKIYNELQKKCGFEKIEKENLKVLQNKKPLAILRELKIPLLKLPLLMAQVRTELKKRMHKLKPKENMDKILATMKKQDYKMYIVSSNSAENIQLFLNKNELPFFEHIYTDRSIIYKHKKIEKLIKDCNLDKNKTIYIGDEVRDIQAARKAGIKVVAVSWGYNRQTSLANAKPDFLVNDPLELVDCASLFFLG